MRMCMRLYHGQGDLPLREGVRGSEGQQREGREFLGHGDPAGAGPPEAVGSRRHVPGVQWKGRAPRGHPRRAPRAGQEAREMSTFLDSTFLIDLVEDPAATRDAARAKKLQLQYEAVIQSTMVMDLSQDDALRAASWSGALRREGKQVGVDAITAALAYRAGCTAILT